MKAATRAKPAPKESESREARIERVRLAVADGSYQVDGLAVSQALIRKSIVRKPIAPAAKNQ